LIREQCPPLACASGESSGLSDSMRTCSETLVNELGLDALAMVLDDGDGLMRLELEGLHRSSERSRRNASLKSFTRDA